MDITKKARLVSGGTMIAQVFLTYSNMVAGDNVKLEACNLDFSINHRENTYFNMPCQEQKFYLRLAWSVVKSS